MKVCPVCGEKFSPYKLGTYKAAKGMCKPCACGVAFMLGPNTTIRPEVAVRRSIKRLRRAYTALYGVDVMLKLLGKAK